MKEGGIDRWNDLKDALIRVAYWTLAGTDINPDDTLTFMVGDKPVHSDDMTFDNLISFLSKVRVKARAEKDWEFADQLRAKLEALGFTVQDSLDYHKVAYSGKLDGVWYAQFWFEDSVKEVTNG